MVILRTLLLLCGALAVLTLGALPAAASGPAMPPCHDMPGMTHDTPAQAPAEAPIKAPDKVMKVMGCCIMCVTAPVPSPVNPAVAPLADAAHRPLTTVALKGHGPAPEHGPPRA